MKTILRIARTELKTLFYSPIAWFLLIIYFIQFARGYLMMIKMGANITEFGSAYALSKLEKVTSIVFLGINGVTTDMLRNLYLYIPLLTMGLISREVGSGTIKLLYSSPIKTREIVLGKFAAIMTFNLLLLAIAALFSFFGIIHIQNAETGMLITGLLGFYLLLCTYSAIGLFMSTLSTYQVVAALATFVVIGVMSYLDLLWQRVDFVRDLTYYLSLYGRADNLLRGLIVTKDVVYFILIISLFISFSIYKLRGGMESKPWTTKALRYVGALTVVFVVGYITSIPSLVGYYDATRGKTHTLTPVVKEVMEQMAEAPLEITPYSNLLDFGTFDIDGPDSYNVVKKRWDPYLRYNPNIKLNKKISYYDSLLSAPGLFANYPGKNLKEIAAQHANMYDTDISDYLAPEEIRKIIDLRPELNRYVMQVKWKDQIAWLRVYGVTDDAWPSGTEIAVVMKRLQKEKMPKVAFITGAVERDINRMSSRDLKSLVNNPMARHSMINQGFDVMSLDLSTHNIPDDVNVLVLADPKFELHPAAKERLMNYVNNGGNLLIAGEPGRQSIMNPLLQPLGVQMTDGTLIFAGLANSPPHATFQTITPLAGSFYNFLEKARKKNSSIAVDGATSLTWADTGSFAVKPLLETTENTWRRLKPYSSETMVMAKLNPPGNLIDNITKAEERGVITYEPQDGDVMARESSMVSLTRKINNKEQRIVVAADADFFCNQILSTYEANYYLSVGVFSWLTGGKFPLDSSRPDPMDTRTAINVKEVERLNIVLVWIVPILMLVGASIVLIRRKRK